MAVTGGKAYYALGGAPPLMAAGAVLADRWLSRGPVRLKAVAFASAALVSGALTIYLTLPILPPATFAKTSLPSVDPLLAEQVGWPEFAATVEQVVDGLSADKRARAVILTNSYSEASALVLLGSGRVPVYSGHNGYWEWGPPPDDRTVVVHVGDWTPAEWGSFFIDCRDMLRTDNGLGIKNGHQGTIVSVCGGLRAPWTEMWPSLRHLS